MKSLSWYIENFLSHRLINEASKTKYRQILNESFNILRSHGIHRIISLNESDIILLYNELKGNRNTKSWKLSYVSTFLKYYDNNIVEKLPIPGQNYKNSNIEWFDRETAKRIYSLALKLGSPYDIIVNLSLQCMHRNIEILRCKTNFLEGNFILIHGKGRYGGKYRRIPIHKDTNYLFNKQLKNKVVDNGYLLDYNSKNRVYILFSHLNKAYYQLYKEKIRITSHKLRRTYARELYYSGVPLKIISGFLGHEDTKTTEIYIGLDFDRMLFYRDIDPLSSKNSLKKGNFNLRNPSLSLPDNVKFQNSEFTIPKSIKSGGDTGMPKSSTQTINIHDSIKKLCKIGVMGVCP